MKRIVSLCLVFLIALTSSAALAKSKKMDTDLPPWTEETVRQYVLDYIEGKEPDRLYSYFDLQIRRYMPLENFKSLLVDWQWMTGDFVCLGSYSSFVDEELELKTHVVHLCMEKMDLDLYFTHKNEEDDWEVMALEFVPAERQNPEDVLPTTDDSLYTLDNGYTETEVTVGKDPFLLNGILTVPEGASSEHPCPVCVFIHEDGPFDMDLTLGKTAMFKDLAKIFAEMGIATLRYDKRTYAYPNCEVTSVVDDVIEDAIFALQSLSGYDMLDTNNVFVLGLGFGGTMVPRIVTEAEMSVRGMLIIHGTAETKVQYDYDRISSTLSEEDLQAAKNFVRNGAKMKREDTLSMTIMGKNAFYYWELLQKDQSKLITKLKLPLCIIQSRENVVVSRSYGLVSYQKSIGKKTNYVTWLEFRNVNHLLMKMLNTDADGNYTYDVETHVDQLCGMDIANWILSTCE